MNSDRNVKDLLDKWGTEQTADNFTAKTMNRINDLYAAKSKHQIILSFQTKYAYAILVLLVLSCLAVTYLFLKPLQLSSDIQLAVSKISPQHLYSITILIPAFWLLMFINILLENRTKLN